MLPSIFDNFDEIGEDQEIIEQQEPLKTYKINPETGEIYSVYVDDEEAIAQYIIKAIKTTRDRYLIYSSSYGSEIEYILNRNYSEENLKTELERLIEECLADYDRVLSIIDLKFERRSDTFYIEAQFEIDTSEIITVEVTV